MISDYRLEQSLLFLDDRDRMRFIEQEQLLYGIVINNASSICMLSDRIIQIPAGCL